MNKAFFIILKKLCKPFKKTVRKTSEKRLERSKVITAVNEKVIYYLLEPSKVLANTQRTSKKANKCFQKTREKK